jgi:hypothetical protein
VNVSSPSATGPAGPAFEVKLGAAWLTLLLTGGAPLWLGTGRLRAVHLQAAHLGAGWHTDDILLEAVKPNGEQIKAALQAKRSFTLGRNEECTKVLRGALKDLRNTSQFDQACDVLGVVTSSLSAKLARGVRTLLDCARASISAADMASRLSKPNYLGKPAREYYNTIKQILSNADAGAPNEEELWRFLCRFHIADLDLDNTNGMTETMLRSLLAATLPEGDPAIANETWTELVSLALETAGSAMSFTLEKLPSHMIQRHRKVTGYPIGVARLLEDTQIVNDSIRTVLGDVASIPREELLAKLSELIEEHSLVFVTGEAGSGKSALVKLALAAGTQGDICFALRAVSLAGNHINDVLHRFALTLEGLRAHTALHRKKVLWIDSIERLLEKPPEERAALFDLFRAVKSDPTWRLVVTCRDYSAGVVRLAFFKEVGLAPAELRVGDLSDLELDNICGMIRSLERPLASSSLRRLLKNLFFWTKPLEWSGRFSKRYRRMNAYSVRKFGWKLSVESTRTPRKAFHSCATRHL